MSLDSLSAVDLAALKEVADANKKILADLARVVADRCGRHAGQLAAGEGTAAILAAQCSPPRPYDRGRRAANPGVQRRGREDGIPPPGNMTLFDNAILCTEINC